MRTILLLSGTAAPAVASAIGGLSLSGVAAPGVGASPSGGLSLSGAAGPVPGVLPLGGWTLSGGSIPVAVLAGTGGLTLGGTAAPVPGVIGLGGLTLSGGAVLVAVAAGSGGLSLSGVALVGVAPAPDGGLSLSGLAVPVPGVISLGGLTLSGVATAVAHAATVAATSGGLSLTGHAVASPGLVGTGGLSLAGVAAVTGMHAPPSGFARYPGYFCSWVTGWRTTYYPGSSGLVAGGLTLDTLPGTFLAAVRTTLRADAGLMGMLRGGVWHRVAPPGVREPLVVYSVRVDKRINSSYKSFVEEGSLRFAAYATQDRAARDVADRVVDALTDASLAWGLDRGRSMYLSLNTPLSEERPMAGYGGSRAYAAVRVMDFVYQGVEP